MDRFECITSNQLISAWRKSLGQLIDSLGHKESDKWDFVAMRYDIRVASSIDAGDSELDDSDPYCTARGRCHVTYGA